MSTYTVYQKAFYADTKKLFCFIKSGDQHQWNKWPTCRQTCPISFVARGKVKNETERSRITLNGTNIA